MTQISPVSRASPAHMNTSEVNHQHQLEHKSNSMWKLRCILIAEIWMELYFCNDYIRLMWAVPISWEQTNSSNKFAANLNMKGISFFYSLCILGLQSISWDVADNVSHPRRLDPTVGLMTYSFVLYLQHGRHDDKCKPSIGYCSNLSALNSSNEWSAKTQGFLHIGIIWRYY